MALSILCQLPTSAQAQTADKALAKRDYDFAVVLFDQGDYYRAVTEFKRFDFDEGNQAPSLTASYAIACCYQHAKMWPDAIKAWQGIANTHPNQPIAFEATYRMAECYIAAGDTASAQTTLRNLANTMPPDSMYASDTRFLIGILLMTQREWPSAEEQFTGFVASYPTSHLRLSAEKLAQACRDIQSGKKKSPKTAGFYSAVIPGLGQAYSGRTGDGLAALVINLTVGLITANQISRQNTFGTVVGLLTFDTFYAGNIYGAIGDAKAYNRAKEDKKAEAASASIRDNISLNLGHPTRLRPYALDADLNSVP
jgi:tetratricopeptide (TPR) repeat protein